MFAYFQIRSTRDNAATTRALKALEDACVNGGNLMEMAVEAARQRATVGEISDAMEKVKKKRSEFTEDLKPHRDLSWFRKSQKRF